MDFENMSSPLAMRSSLPPSSAPDPTHSINDGSPRRPQVADALTLGDDEAEDNEDAQSGRKRRRPKGTQNNGDVPLVKDAVGESVAESFETLLKTYVHVDLALILHQSGHL